MKYLKRFNEAVIPAYDFTEALDKLRSMENITLDNLKEIFGDMNVEFVNVEYFKSQLQTKKEIELVPVNMPPLMGGVRWGAHNVYTDKMYICIDENVFLKSINGEIKPQLLDFLEEVLRHESIHKQQAQRRPDITVRNLERSPKDPKKYFGSTDEIMAYADSFIVQCRKRNLSDDDIIDALRGGKKVSWIQNVYSSMDLETQKRFKKYVYQYIKNN
jgi:hypothetical protein